MDRFRRTELSERQQKAIERQAQQLRQQRRSRFRILACIGATEESLVAVRMAASLAPSDDCDIIVLYVRPTDQGLHSGGLQVKLARENMLEAGLDLPGIRHLKSAKETLKACKIHVDHWPAQVGHQDAWDAAGDNKVEYKSPKGRGVVFKLKTAPDIASGILDQYELGPYNLLILGEPSRWQGEMGAILGSSGIVQKITMRSPCSVLVARAAGLAKRGFFICTDGSSRSMQAVRRAAVLAHMVGEPITLFSVAREEAGLAGARENVENAAAMLKAMGIAAKHLRTAKGKPASEIIAAGSDHRVIVVTDEGRSFWQRLWRGSTAYEVVRGARTSVLDVR